MDDLDLSTWRGLLGAALRDQGEHFSDLESCTLTQAELDRKFYADYGEIEGLPFTAWTPSRVYFPTVYDGREGVASVPRHPTNGEKTKHVGKW